MLSIKECGKFLKQNEYKKIEPRLRSPPRNEQAKASEGHQKVNESGRSHKMQTEYQSATA